MPEMTAKLMLDATPYETAMAQLGRMSQAELGKISNAAKSAGQNLTAMAEQSKSAMASAGSAAESAGGRFEKAFGHIQSLDRLIGAFVLVRAAGAAASSAFAQAAAGAQLETAVLSGGAEDVLKAQLKMQEADEQILQGIPIIGGLIIQAMRKWGDREGIEEAIRNIHEVEEATKKEEELAAQWHEDTLIRNAKLDGKSDAEIAAMKARGNEAKDAEKVAAAQELVRKAINDQVDAQARLNDALALQATLRSDQSLYGLRMAAEHPEEATEAAVGYDIDAVTAARAVLDKVTADMKTQMADAHNVASQAAARVATDARETAATAAREQEKTTDKEKQELDKRVNAEIEALDRTKNIWFQEYEEAVKTTEKEFDVWKSLSDKRLADAERLQTELRNIERGELTAQESYQDRLSKMAEDQQKSRDEAEVAAMRQRAEGERDPRRRREMEEAAERRERQLQQQAEARKRQQDEQNAQRYSQRAGQEFQGGAGDMEETRRLLEKGLDFAEAAGDKNLMARIEQRITATFEAQKSATSKALSENKAALKTLADQITEIEAKASKLVVHLDVAEALTELNRLRAAMGLSAVRTLPGSAASPSGPAYSPGISNDSLLNGLPGAGYDDGGYVAGPSGIDTIPAWLTPGEFVVNAASAQRNRWLLSALNDGVTIPAFGGGAQYFARGGQAQKQDPPIHLTANIVVNPPPNSNPRDIARMVVDEISRLKIRGRG